MSWWNPEAMIVGMVGAVLGWLMILVWRSLRRRYERWQASLYQRRWQARENMLTGNRRRGN